MKLPTFSRLFGGGGGGKCVSRLGLINGCCTRKPENNVTITGSIVLLLVLSFVGDCVGKPFHTGGQAEIEEDTSQGSLKEKYAPAGALLLGSPSGSVGIHSSLAEEGDDGDQEVNEDDAMVRSIGLLPLGTLDDGSQKSHLGYDTTFPYSGDYKTHRHPSHSSNYEAAVRKRSLGGRSYSFDDGSDAEEFQRVQRFAGQNTRPMYFDQNGASATPVESDISASPAGVHQKLMSLRNQYGNKWLNFVGPYAYRKRQILYRQCFFNPISCF